MPAMVDAERRTIVEEILSKNHEAEPDSLTFEDLLAAVAATDDWIVANAVAFNQALPLPARTTLTTRQKAWIFSLVQRRRYLINA